MDAVMNEYYAAGLSPNDVVVVSICVWSRLTLF